MSICRLLPASSTLAVLTIGLSPAIAAAADPAEPAVRMLREVTVSDSAASPALTRGQLPELTPDGRLTVGKRTTVIELEEQPVIVNNNLRQTFARLPGLLVSEQQIPSIFNVNYRGLGDPHESEYVAFFENGLPLGSDPIGYSTLYYLPPTQRVDSVEFIRGGSSLLYGPQLGPAINFITTRADPDQLGLHYATEHAGGTDGLYSTFNEVSWGDGTWGTYAEFDHRQADGERNNSDYGVTGGRVSVAYQAVAATRLGFDFYAFNSDSGEAGRLTLSQFNADPERTTRSADRVFIDKYFGAITLDHDFDRYGTLHAKVFGGYQDRYSRRQNATGTLTNLDRREFNTFGADIRQVLPWGGGHVLTAGYTVYHDDAPRSRFTNPDIQSSREVTPVFDQDLGILYNAVFAENAFRFGRIAIAPALRWEHIDYSVDEALEIRDAPRGPLDFDRTVEALLLGVGLSFDLTPELQAYANASESYRPPTFDDLASPTTARFIPGLTDTTSGRNYEIGLRGAPLTGLSFDVAVFRVEVEDRVETQRIGADDLRLNSGDSEHEGVEFQLSYDPLARLDSADRLEVFVNGAWLDAEITASQQAALVGRTPAYAPDYLLRTGVIYNWQDRAKLAVTSTLVDEEFWQDSNLGNAATQTAVIPAFEIVDVSGEFRVSPEWTAFGGINNIADQRYFSRVRADGIEPAADRTFYAGLRYSL
jgi:Fe(3+) dicitrate transport protein